MRYAPSLLLFVWLFAVSGCGDAPAPPAQSQTLGGVKATLTSDPSPPEGMKPVVLMLTLKDDQGRAVENAQVILELTMPEMTMPKANPTAEPERQGLYRARTIFTMTGKWRIQAKVTLPLGELDYSFDITVE